MVGVRGLPGADASLQEDEEEIAKRKMKAEEEEVEIDFVVGGATRRDTRVDGSQTEDEDIAWADQDADKDLGLFKMKIIMQEDSEL
jgi:COMPASS component SWD1